MVFRSVLFFLLLVSQSVYAYKWHNVDGGVFYICGNEVSKLQLEDYSDVKSVEYQQNGNKLPSSGYTFSALYAGMTVDAVITLKDGTVTTETIKILDEPKWTLKADEGKSQICNGVAGTLKAVVRQGTRKIPADFKWEKDGAEVSTSESFSSLEPGKYTLTATAYGCEKSVVATINPSPKPSISGNDGLCIGETLTLTASDMDDYVWENGETTKTATFSSSGDYYVAGSKQIGRDVCLDTLHFTIKRKASANVKIAGVTSFCPGETETTISASHSLLEAQIVSYEWSSGGVPLSSDKSLLVTAEGRYKVEVKTEDGCKSSGDVVIGTTTSVGDVTIPNLTDEICSGSQASFSAEGSDLTYFEWYGSGEPFGTGQSQYAIQKAGDYSVVGYTSNGCQSKAFSFHIDEIKSPAISVTSVAPCEGEVRTLTATYDAGTQFSWISPDSILGLTSASVEIFNTGHYRARVKDPATGCVSEAYTDVAFLPYPVLSLNGNLAFCENELNVIESVVENRSDTRYSYSWADSDGMVVCGDSFVVLKKSGDYELIVSNSHNCETRLPFSVFAAPSPKLSGDTAKHLCENSTVTLTMNGADHYSWSKQGRHLGTDSNKYKATSSGTFMVIGTNDDGCSDTARVKVELAVKPKITDLIKPACGADEGMITLQTDKPCFFKWPDGSADSTFAFSDADSYTVVVTDSVSGCRTNHKVSSVVRDIPVGRITSTLLDACDGDSLVIEALFEPQDGDVFYSWNCVPDTSSSIVVKRSGDVVVTATDSFGCKGTSKVNVVFHPLPEFEINSADVVCVDSSAVLSAESVSVLDYVWQNGVAANTITVDTAGIYSCTATDAYGCVSSRSKEMVVKQPKVMIVGKSELCRDSIFSFLAEGDCKQYYWNDETVASPFCFASPGLVRVVGVDSFGCRAYAEKLVAERKAPTLVAPDTVSFCERGSVDFVVRSFESVRFEWDDTALTGDLVSTNVKGTHTLVGYDTAGCASLPKTVFAKEIALPRVQIDGVDHLCGVSDSVTLNANVVDCTRLHWNTGDTASSIEIFRPGEYTVVGYNGGCVSDTARYNVRKLPLPEISFAEGKMKSFCRGSSVSFVAESDDGARLAWSNGVNGIRIDVDEEGYYKVEATDLNGCKSVDSVYARRMTVPFISISGDSVLCEKSSVDLVANGVECRKIIWNDGSVGKTMSVDGGGDYWVVGYDTMGCRSDTARHKVSVRNNPKVTISGVTQISSSQTTTLTAVVSESDGSGYRYVWMPNRETNDRITVDGSSINMYANYSVTVYDEYGCFDHSAVRVTTSPLSVSGKFEFCESDSTTVSIDAPSSAIIKWSDGTMGRSATFSTSGKHFVVATALDGSVDTVYFQTNMWSKPSLVISGPTSMCDGDTAVLHAQTDAQYMRWNTGADDAEIVVRTGGGYVVVATSEHGCTNEDSVWVTANELPRVSISGPDTLIRGTSGELVASGAKTYVWNHGTHRSASIEIAEAGRYRVEGTDSAGCTGYAYKDVEIREVPTPMVNDALGGELTICEGDSVLLIASGGDYYVWDDGRRGYSIYANESRVYSVSVCLNNGECRDASFNVRVVPLPTIEVVGKRHICEGEMAVLTAMTTSGSNVLSYEWSDGNSGPTHLVAISDTLSVVAKDANGCESNRVETIVEMQKSEDIILFGDFDICSDGGDVADLKVDVSNLSKVVWIDASSGDTLSYGDEFSVVVSGKYEVLTKDNNGCDNKKMFVVRERQLPEIEILGAETPVCGKEYARLLATSDENCTFEWNTGDVGNELKATTGGRYSVVGTNEYGCKKEASTYLIFNDIPDMMTTGDFKICPGESVAIGVTGADDYEWSGAETPGLASVPYNSIHGDECIFTEPGNGYVLGTDKYGCKKRIDFKIEEVSVPNVVISAIPAKIRRGDSEVTFSLQSDDDLSDCIFNWLMSDGGSTAQQTFSYTFDADEALLFSASAVIETKEGCKLRLHTTIESEFVIPNTFTPNGDMINDHFMKGYHVEIKDRHGIMVHTGSDGWDGVLPNGKITPDTYYYIVTDKIGQKHYGYVTVAG